MEENQKELQNSITKQVVPRKTKGRVLEEIPESSTSWSFEKLKYHVSDPASPPFITAQLLIDKGYSIQFEESGYFSKSGRPVMNVYAKDQEANTMFDTVHRSPEFRALDTARDGNPFSKHRLEAALKEVEWDNQTKQRVQAFYLSSLAREDAETYETIANRLRPIEKKDRKYMEKLKKEIAKNREKASQLLGDQDPIRPEDIRSLLLDVLDRGRGIIVQQKPIKKATE